MSEHVDYVFLLPGHSFSRQFLNSWSQTLVALSELGITFKWYTDYTPIISLTRNRLLGYAGPTLIDKKLSTTVFQGQLTCNKVVFVDSDIVWSVNDFLQLLASGEDVVGASYVTSNRYSVAALQDPYTLNIHDLTGELIPVTSMGLGLVVCSFEVLQQMSYPWFSVVEHEDGSRVTEDVYFFNKVRELGYTPYLHSGVRVGHVKDLVLTVGEQS